jgi:hypothetical protein
MKSLFNSQGFIRQSAAGYEQIAPKWKKKMAINFDNTDWHAGSTLDKYLWKLKKANISRYMYTRCCLTHDNDILLHLLGAFI